MFLLLASNNDDDSTCCRTIWYSGWSAYLLVKSRASVHDPKAAAEIGVVGQVEIFQHATATEADAAKPAIREVLFRVIVDEVHAPSKASNTSKVGQGPIAVLNLFQPCSVRSIRRRASCLNASLRASKVGI